MKRFALFLLALALLPGCDAFGGPKSAKGAPAAPAVSAAAQKVYDSEFQRLTSENATTHDKLDGIGVKLDLVQATIDALSTPEEAVPQSAADKVREIGDAIAIEIEPALEAPPPLPSEAAATSLPPARLVTIDGVEVDVDAFLKQWYRGKYVGVRNMTIEKHLGDHGVTAGISQLSNDERFKLHSALHEREKSQPRTVSKFKTVVRAPAAPAPSGCATGNCPLMQTQTYRVGPFGGMRLRRRG